MKRLPHIALALTALSMPSMAAAQATPLALDELVFETVHEVAERSILARNSAGQPLVALLKLDKGDFLPPHGARGVLRLITIISGDLSWGDGGEADVEKERVFGAGTLLVLPADSGEHWAAARQGKVLLQVTFIRDGNLVLEAAAQVATHTN